MNKRFNPISHLLNLQQILQMVIVSDWGQLLVHNLPCHTRYYLKARISESGPL